MISKKIAKKLTHRKYRDQHDLFLVEGIKGVEEILKEGTPTVEVYLSEDTLGDRFQQIRKRLEQQNRSYQVLSIKELSQMSETKNPPGILAIVKQLRWSLDDFDYDRPIIVLDQVNDPGNLGTIIRTADWFGILQIIVSAGSVDVYHPKVVRSTMGSILRVKVVMSTDIVQDVRSLREDAYHIVGLDMVGDPIHTLEKNPKTVYILGSESHGLSVELRPLLDQTVTILGRGEADSLNVAVAAGILFSRL